MNDNQSIGTALPQSFIALGWREWLALPRLGISRIEAKVDTGARTSALHADSIETYYRGDEQRVKFGICPTEGSDQVLCDAKVLDEREVTNSGGFTESRVVIKTTIILGGIRRQVELTLTNRELMKFQMLLGRTALRGQFYIDPGHSHLLGKPTV
ncbi:MAG: ATP-dependent zinc protease [Proteobacteria bacterium]|jgi:hypothetical protein|nr:ATP-dependent zinc protease [Pseudomonadota bacterium]